MAGPTGAVQLVKIAPRAERGSQVQLQRPLEFVISIYQTLIKKNSACGNFYLHCPSALS